YEYIRSVFVPGAKQIEYLVQLNSKDFLSGLPKILIPGFEKENIRAFEMTTEEMHDNFQGINYEDIVIGKKIDLKKLRQNFVYVFVLSNELIIRRFDATGEILVLKADNPGFPVKQIQTGDLLEIWELVGFFSRNIKPPSILSERIMHLENAVEKLESRIKKLEKGT